MDMLKLFPVSELPEGSRRVVDVDGRKVLILNYQGEFHAVDNACPHLRFPLKDGGVSKDGALVCPFHHSAFDLKTGDVKDWSPWPPGFGPVLGKFSREKALAIFETRVEDGFLFVSKNAKVTS